MPQVEIGGNDVRISDMGPDGNQSYGAYLPAAAYNPADNEYQVVWYGSDNTGGLQPGEFEIYGQRIDADTGAEVGVNDFRLSSMGPNGDADFGARSPAVAYNSIDHEYLVVWAGNDVAKGLFEIHGQRIDAKTGAHVGDNDFLISDMFVDGFSPAVVHNFINNEYLVVWEGSDWLGSTLEPIFEIFGQRIDGETGAALGTDDFVISDMGPDGDSSFRPFNPAVAYNSTDNEYLVVWYGSDNTGGLVPGELEIFGQRIDAASGVELSPNDFRISNMGPDGDTSFSAQDPAIAYNATDNEYLVVWDGDTDAGGMKDGDREIFGQRIDGATGAETGASNFRISDMGPDGSAFFPAYEPAVAHSSTNNEYIVTWWGSDDIGPLAIGQKEIFGQRIDGATGVELGANDVRLSDTGPEDSSFYGAWNPTVACKTADDVCLVAWSGNDNIGILVTNENEIFAQRVALASMGLFIARESRDDERSGLALQY